jgi:hypothetical protein
MKREHRQGGTAKAGNTKQGIAIALDVEQLVSQINTLLKQPL